MSNPVYEIGRAGCIWEAASAKVYLRDPETKAARRREHTHARARNTRAQSENVNVFVSDLTPVTDGRSDRQTRKTTRRCRGVGTKKGRACL